MKLSDDHLGDEEDTEPIFVSEWCLDPNNWEAPDAYDDDGNWDTYDDDWLDDKEAWVRSVA